MTHSDDKALLQKVRFLIGDKSIFDSPKPEVPFAESTCVFLDALSQKIRSCPKIALFPDLAAFGFWCRKGNLNREKLLTLDEAYRLGRGLFFHIAPSNVPINCAFSLVFGLLAGCVNLVRVPTKPFPQVQLFVQLVNELLQEEKFTSMRRRIALVQYERDEAVTRWISERSDGRMIWGGDATIGAIRSLAMKPRGVEITFADRYSFALIDSDAVSVLNENELASLSKRFYNDTYTMDQNACSSPHFVVWLGKNDDGQGTESIRNRFWEAVAKEAARFDFPAIKAVDKLTRLCINGIEREGGLFCPVRRWGNRLYVVETKQIPQPLDTLRGIFGLFYEYQAASLDELTDVVNEKFQTITTFGIDNKTVADWGVRNSLTGIDRIVPIGNALAIEPIWDGFNIIQTLTRIISY